MSNLLVQMTGRLDLVLVYRIAGLAIAGTYSIALTVGALVGGVPIALAFASFPPLAQLEDDDRAFTFQLFRMGLVSAATAAVLALLTRASIMEMSWGQAPEDVLLPANATEVQAVRVRVLKRAEGACGHH